MVTMKETPKSNNHLGLLGEFAGPDALVNAAEQLHRRGYKRLDAFSPFPIHRLDQALGIRSSRLPWLVLVVGVIGGVVAIAFQWVDQRH